MINQLYIENIALIKEETIDFKEGLNIITGETGAGKSMVLRSISFVLGGRVTRELIRRNESKAEVRCIFFIKDIKMIKKLKEYSIEVDDNNEILLSRVYYRTGRSQCKVNNKIVTLGIIKSIGEILVEQHSQHQSQVLLDRNKHIKIIDDFCGDEILVMKEKLKDELKKYREYKEKLKSITSNREERETRVDILKYQINEIEKLNLKEEEEKYLLAEKRKLNDREKIVENLEKSSFLISSSDSSILDKLNEVVNALSELEDVDENCKKISDDSNNLLANVEELSFNIRNYYDALEFGENIIDDIEARLDEIYKVKKKYGDTIKDVLKFMERGKKELKEIDISDDKIKRVEKEMKKRYEIVASTCSKMSKIRKKASKEVERKIILNLKELSMDNSLLKIDVEKKDQITEDGNDRISFYISTNKGGELKPLEKIVSGGEMSRLTLAIKSSLVKKGTVGTFVFDEIDTGISGKTAQKVGLKIMNLGKEYQIICITHLPQIASLGNAHLRVSKESNNKETYTNVEELVQDEIVDEISRLLSGDPITEETRTVAIQLINQKNKK